LAIKHTVEFSNIERTPQTSLTTSPRGNPINLTGVPWTVQIGPLPSGPSHTFVPVTMTSA
jgi:hypothetical protein